MPIAMLVAALVAAGGRAAMPVLEVGTSVRGAAIGGAFAAIAGGPDGWSANPAGLVNCPGFAASFSHNAWVGSTSDEFLHSTTRLASGAVGAGLAYSREPGIERWDESNNFVDSFATWNAACRAGFGLQISSFTSIGGALTGLYQGLDVSSNWGGAVTLGATVKVLPFLSLAGVARDIGGVKQASGWAMTPAEFVAGGAYAAGSVAAALDVVQPIGGTTQLRAGLEYAPVEEFALRVGYRTGQADLSTLGLVSGLSAGLGFRVREWSIDYGVSPLGQLGFTHRLGVTFSRVDESERPGALVIRTVDGETREPVDAHLVVTGVAQFTGESGSDGLVTLRRLEPGSCVVTASAVGHDFVIDTTDVVAGRTTELVLVLPLRQHSSVTGVIREAGSGKPIGGLVKHTGPAAGNQPADRLTGGYTIRSLPAGVYELTATGPDSSYIPQTCTLLVPGARLVNRDFSLLRKRETIVLEGVNFETGKAEIRPEFEPALRRAGEMIKSHRGITVEVAGHTDPREIRTPEFASNWDLSLARARAVADYLVDKCGVSADRLAARGYADTQPVAANDTEEGMALNRRTEFRVLD